LCSSGGDLPIQALPPDFHESGQRVATVDVGEHTIRDKCRRIDLRVTDINRHVVPGVELLNFDVVLCGQAIGGKRLRHQRNGGDREQG
jgi:hypothetical protein